MFASTYYDYFNLVNNGQLKKLIIIYDYRWKFCFAKNLRTIIFFERFKAINK